MSDVPLRDIEKAAQDVGDLLKPALPEGVGFALHLWTLGEGGWATFISNVERDDHIRALREMLEKADPDNATPSEELLVLDLIVAEWESDPTSTACFDRRLIERAKKLVERLR